jgi:hypothetical protein
VASIQRILRICLEQLQFPVCGLHLQTSRGLSRGAWRRGLCLGGFEEVGLWRLRGSVIMLSILAGESIKGNLLSEGRVGLPQIS